LALRKSLNPKVLIFQTVEDGFDQPLTGTRASTPEPYREHADWWMSP